MMNYNKLCKKARNCMLVAEILLALICSGIITLIILVAGLPKWLLAIAGIICIASLVSPFIRYERYRYRFTDEEIDVKEGIISIQRNVVPIERLHKISMQSGPIDRIFGLAKVIVTTAGGDVVIRFLEMEQAEQIVERLKNRINQYAKAEKEGAGE